MHRSWGSLTWEEIQQAAEDGAMALLPCGSTEQHGPMLPVDTDAMLARRMTEGGARIAAERKQLDILVMPVLAYGLSEHHTRFPGTITLSPITYIEVASEILHSVLKAGFQRVGIVSGHGGNNRCLEVAAQRVACETTDTTPARIAVYRMGPELDERKKEAAAGYPEEGQFGGHACRTEVSMSLAERPELVRMEKSFTPELKVDAWPMGGWVTHELTESGALGDPSQATAELGEKLWAALDEDIATFLERLAECPLPAV